MTSLLSVATQTKPPAGRLELGAPLGAGAHGSVHEAWDRERGTWVALKALHRADPESLLRFKREFRALAALDHPGVVRVHELCCEAGALHPAPARPAWFFTMERLCGLDLITHLRAGRRPGSPPPSYGAVRRAFGELALALDHVHHGGYLHLDLKPAHVLVISRPGGEGRGDRRNAGRIVLLDFGLSAPRGSRSAPAEPSSDTAAYAAPEQVAGGPLGPASDWYGVGVLLLEALTGRLPHALAPVPTSTPAPLATLCAELLAAEPAARPGGDEVRRRLGVTRDGSSAIDGGGGGGPVTLAALAALRDALAGARRGRGELVALADRGSGSASRLAHHSLARLSAEDPELVILAGRADRRERLPYRAVDAAIDELGDLLLTRPAEELAALIPADVLALARLFPTLERVPAIAQAARRVFLTSRPRDLRRRAFAALRELLSRLATRAPLLLLLDRLENADPESAALLAALHRGPVAPPFATLATFRRDAGRHPLRRTLARLG